MPELTLSSGAASDTGRLRELNEDRYWIDADRGVFVQAFGERGLDAAVLRLPTVDFIAYDDERMVRVRLGKKKLRASRDVHARGLGEDNGVLADEIPVHRRMRTTAAFAGREGKRCFR